MPVGKPTVVILGAGASYECGMPLGSKLRDTIADGLAFYFGEDVFFKSGDAALYELLKQHYGHDHENMLLTARNIASAGKDFPSIDEVLRYFQKQPLAVDIGKLAVAYYILAAETNSRLGKTVPGLHLAELSQSWYAQFFSIAISGLDREGIATLFDNVTFINFNYDRTLECYVFHALVKAAVSVEAAADIVARMKIIRPYGVLGAIDWGREGRIGGPLDETLFDRVKNIRTFTEVHEKNVKEEIDTALGDSRVVLCLGFGFHPQNMEILSSPSEEGVARRGRLNNTRKVFATMKSFYQENKKTFMQDLVTALTCQSDHITILDMTAGEMLTALRPMIERACR
jgi:hypothetical protein